MIGVESQVDDQHINGMRTRVLGVPVDVLTGEELIRRVGDLLQGPRSRLVCYVNADCVNQAVLDRRYRAILHEADLVYADGIGVVWASRLTAHPLPERITLGDALPALCEMAQARGLRLFLLGGVPGVARRAAARLTRRFPSLQIVGAHRGFFPPEDTAAVIGRINEAKPHILLVGMGVPKQEKWIWQHRHKLHVPVLWGVGALFDYYAGIFPRAPVWLRRLGMEWAFRLLVEPKRLWRRYLLGHAFFVVRTSALLLIDAGLVTASWLGAYWIWRWLDRPFGFTINPIDPYVRAIALIVAVWLVACASFGLYRRSATMSAFAELSQVIRATSLGLLSTMAVSFLLREFSVGRPVVLLAGALTFVTLSTSRLITRALERRLAQRGVGLRRALIIGTGPLAERLKEEIEIWPVGYDVVGYVRDGEAVGETSSGKVIGSIADLERLIPRWSIHDVFVASRQLPLHEKLNLLEMQERWRVDFHVVSEELEPFAKRQALGRAVELPLLELPTSEPGVWYEWSKRGFDVMSSGLGVAFGLPLLVVLALAIRLESPGRAVFAQQRVGRKGRVFRMYKFRTMNEDTDPYAVAPNDVHDPRVTRFGRFLRRWSLDELPQLVNVLKGEMSLVGPRPEMPFLVREYQPWQRRRLTVKPGLTGLWQVVGRKELPLHRHIEYDLYYVRHRGWWLDATILLQTVPAVLCRRGAY